MAVYKMSVVDFREGVYVLCVLPYVLLLLF